MLLPKTLPLSMPKYGHRRQIPLPPGMYDARSPVEFSAKIQNLYVHASGASKRLKAHVHALNLAYDKNTTYFHARTARIERTSQLWLVQNLGNSTSKALHDMTQAGRPENS